jgi:2-keto-myo-inositol isomerase
MRQTMTRSRPSRREFLAGATAVVGSLLLARAGGAAAPSAEGKGPFRLCLNTATIMGKNLPITDEVETAAKAGYDGIEPWVRKIEDYRDKGGSLADLRKRISDLGLTVEGAIGFTGWITDDEAQRAKGVEQMKRDMALVAQVGAVRIAAPPVGATDKPGLDLDAAAERYRVILDAGEAQGVIPQLELWGHSKNLSRLGQCMHVIVESGHPKAGLLGDFYHIYKGGSDFAGLAAIGPSALQVFHMNDYPGLPRQTIADKDRVMPGDGVGPLAQVLRGLLSRNCRPVLSLELFNRQLWDQDPLEVARQGIAKMRAVISKATG